MRVRGGDERLSPRRQGAPEYRTDDGTQRLWDFLLSVRDRMPSRDEMIRRAMQRLEHVGDRALPVETVDAWEDF